MLPGLDLYYTDPAQPLTTEEGDILDYLDHDLIGPRASSVIKYSGLKSSRNSTATLRQHQQQQYHQQQNGIPKQQKQRDVNNSTQSKW